MFSIVHASFWAAAFATSFMGIGLMIPLWLGRKNPDDSLELYGAFYQFLCRGGRCQTYSRWLDSDAVPIEADTWGIELSALPALALVGFLLCFIAVTVLEIFSCRCCARPRTWRVIMLATLLLAAAALFTTLTVFMAIYTCFEFYRGSSIDHIAEFPWSLMCYAIAAVLVILSVVLFVVILCNWSRYGDLYQDYDDLQAGSEASSWGGWYSRSGYPDRRHRSTSPSRYSDSISDVRSRGSRSQYRGRNGYTNPGYSRESSFTNLSDLGKANSDRSFFDTPKHSGSVMKSSGRAIHDSPRLQHNRKGATSVASNNTYDDLSERL